MRPGGPGRRGARARQAGGVLAWAGGLGLVLAAAAGAGPLLIERDVTVGEMLSDRFTWLDAGGRPRVVVLAHNDGPAGPGGSRGGELRELRYETPERTRIVRASGSESSGFGYVVAHRHEDTQGIPGDADDLIQGHRHPGQVVRVFEGTHHAILRFTQIYPRHSSTTASVPNQRYELPVTVEWLVATGRDHPLWAVTWDLSGVPENDLDLDSRAPYGELLFDGSDSEGGHGLIAGVGWGDRFRFESTQSPLTYNSAWTWSAPNTVPHVRLWTTEVDATMGTVQTQTIEQHDAGGYFGTDRWGSTSDDGSACTEGDVTLMPCNFNWPYQSVNYSLDPASPDTATNSTRLAWGTSFGFLGQSAFLVHGSEFWGGPLPDATASGWPYQSYSTFVVLGLHSENPVGRQVAEVETVQGTTVTAAVGEVAAGGPAGIARPDTASYQPRGWNHVYGAWTLRAASNRVDAGFDVGSGTLVNPLVVVAEWTAGRVPEALRLNGALLIPDVDYFPSLRPEARELWITLNRSLAGPDNRLEITGGLALALTLDQPTYRPGDELVLGAVLTPGSASPPVDAYVVLRLPDGTLLSLTLEAALVPGIVPIARGFTPFPFTGDLLRYTFGGTEPVGGYTWRYALTAAGTADILAGISELPFSRVP